ncbi:MAG TPA: MBL fold metallo-hydrolase [Vicinamibacterales bacterium]|nr:MBL fold metallo-hydrolase [Vicinamibacterales bacterium]
MPSIATDISYIDLNFCDTPKAIATGVYAGDGGAVLIDPGPGSCIDTLRASLAAQGIGVGDIESILITHIHLDHAGATGLLVRDNPRIRVFVHEKGAPHVVDPSKLINSANQLWGVEGVARLWGQVIPVPEANLQVLGARARITAGGRTFDVRYTPGHASHHVSYFDDRSGLVWAGDTAGLRFTSKVFTLPPTPPPDIDLEAWRDSLAKIRDWKPETVFITHCGPYAGAAAHLDHIETSLRDVAEMARRAIQTDASDDAKYERFKENVFAYVRSAVDEQEMRPLEFVGPLEFNWRGLVRYWKKKGLA